MKNIDAVIILGGGAGDDLVPTLYTKERLEGFINHLHKYKNTPVVVSGKYSMWLKKAPKYSESDVMKNFLINSGHSKKLIFQENSSRDTVGNIYFSKQIVKKHPTWKNILIVTTKGHELRVDWLLKKIFGAKYKFKYLTFRSSGFSFNNNPNRKKYERYVVGVYKRLLKNIKDGDDQRIMAVLKKKHPVYSKSVDAKKLEREIVETKHKIFGFTTSPKQ